MSILNNKNKLMIVRCTQANWKVTRLNNRHKLQWLLGKLKLPKKGEEYYVKEYIYVKDKVYYILDGLNQEVGFESNHFIFSEANITMQDTIEESLIK